jgi:acyl transferase domain-containing protein/NAD(P)-dependent dehydrogenase (short-subunit alcohol dehydrogenase family)/acyl carrier protein
MEHYSKNYNIIVKNNPCFINHKIHNQYAMPLDGFFELILIYLIKKNKQPYPISFSDLQIKQLLTAEDIQSEKCINLSHFIAKNEINIGEISSNNSSILSGFLSSNDSFKKIVLPDYLPQKLTLQEIYTQEHSEILPFYHSVKEIQYDKHYASAIIQSSLGKSGEALFYNDVTVLNGVFIALINFYMAVNKSEPLCLPFYIRHLSFFKKIEQGNYVLHIERKALDSISLRLLDQNNELIVAADGIELKPLSTNKPAPNPVATASKTKLIPEPIAIIGMSGRFPQSDTLEEFWNNLCNGFDGIRKIVSHRRQDYISETKNKLEYGGFLDEIARFDARFFDISGHEALSMEPQQRLFLEKAWEALEQAGYTNRKQLNCGVYLGITQGDYLSLKNNTQTSVPQSFWGNAPSIAASRIAYFLDLKGPAIAIDTACSSSLTALHMACEQLRNSDLELAIAGGVFITVTDQFHQKASLANMLSPEHQCFAFSEKANGFVPGEAVAAVVLKRLSQAEHDGDFIHAIVVGSGINQDGRTNGITAPNSESQAALQKAVYEQFHIDPNQIGYIEAHGTGTKLGDPIELEGLQKAFSAFTQQKQFCSIGSVKSNIGHAAAAAGISSLIKVCLSLKNQTIPVSRHTQVTNQDIDFKNTAFFPAQETRPWSSQSPLMAAINSFGFSGTNAHVVVKEYLNKRRSLQEKKYYVVPFSAKNYEDLLGYLKDFSAWLMAHDEYDLNSICYTLSCRKKHFDSRFIIAATHKKELIEAIHSLVNKGVDDLAGLGSYVCPSVLNSGLIAKDWFTDFLAKKEISWLDYFEPYERCTVPLPTYHWKKTEYWPHALTTNPTIQAMNYFNLSQNNEYLRDHVVKGVSILPAAAYIAFCHSKLDKNITLTDLYFLHPFIVAREEIIVLDIDEGEQAFTFTKENKIYCHGEFHKRTKSCPETSIVPKKYPYLIKKDEIYARLLSQDLFYGDSLKKLESIAYDETELLAHAHFKSEDDLIAILDVSLQATIVFNSLNKHYLPFYIEALTIYKIPQNDVYIVAKNLALNELSISCSILIFDSNHQLCIDIKGVEARAPKPQIVAASSLGIPKLYFREMEDLVFDKPSKNINTLDNTLVLDNSTFNTSDWQDALNNLIDYASIIKVDLQCSDFDFIDPYETRNLDSLSIYFITAMMFAPSDLIPIKWIFNFLHKLLNTKITKIRLIFIFNEQNAVQIGALEGLMRTIGLETEKINIQLVQVDHADIIPMTLKTALLNQSTLNNNEFVRIGKLHSIPSYREFDSPNSIPVLKKKGVYLISGGSGGIGLQLIQYLTTQYQATIILVSRTIKPELNGAIYQYQCDITQRDELRRSLEEITDTFPVINGLFHLAGLLDDKLFINTNWDSFYRVVAPKLLGVVHLNELTKNVKLDFFCCYSSLSAYVGNPGQSAYAFANSFLDHYMRYRDKLSDGNEYFGLSQSINWPLWKVGGMGSNQETHSASLKQWKLSALDSQRAFSFLEQSLASKYINILIANDYLVSKPVLPITAHTSPAFEVDLKQLLSETLKIPVEEILLEKPFLEYGIDSLLAVGIIEKLSLYYGELPKSLLFELTHLAELTKYLASKKPNNITTSNSEKRDTITLKTDEYGENCIAIIGIAGKYPEADNLDVFWENLRQNKLSITSLNKRSEHDWPYSWAGLINNYDYFDPLFFGISPLDAIKMDPQERQFLQIAYHAFEHAGYPKQRLKKDQRVGVFVGVMYGLYQLNGIEQTAQSDQTVIANSTYSSIANRVSYCLDLEGPSMAVDSMCSSSLTAIHLGMQSLLLGESNMVLCGGVNLITHPYKYAELEQKSFLASDGLCHSFAANGNGYVPGEGVGAIVLKRIADAIRDNDRILGVIRASALNHGGFSSGYTVPKKLAQQKLLSETLAKSGLKAEDIQYIEAHGTGTELGDPIEFRALTEVYGHDSSAEIYLGSLKSNVGHLESAAGIAALTKVLLQMHHHEISPHLLHGNINPNLALADSRFKFARNVIPWQATHKNAAVSSFGAGGSNAHLIVSSYSAKEKMRIDGNPPYFIDVPLYPFEELRYNILNSREEKQSKFRKLKWIKSESNLDKETKLIEQCLVIINGQCPIVAEHINQSSCFVLDLATFNHTLEIDNAIRWLRSSSSRKIVDLVGIRAFEKEIFNQQFDVYQRFLNLFGEAPLTIYSFCSSCSADQFIEYSAYLDALFYVIQAEYNLLNYGRIELDSLNFLKNTFYCEQDELVQATKIKYIEGVRYTRELYVPEPNDSYKKAINPNAYYLITGGSSGIGYLTAQHLVSLGAKKLILMGITSLPEESQWHLSTALSKKQKIIIQNISALLNKGIEVIHSSCSLNNVQELDQVVQPLKNSIAGVIHAAGLTDLKLERLESKTQAEFHEHSNIKYFGLKNILNLIPIANLDFVFAFSSMSSINPKEARGVSSYAFANHVMDSYFEFLSLKYPGTFLSIRWPLWRESTAGQISRSAMLESTDAFSIFDTILTSYRDGVIDVALEPSDSPKETEKSKEPIANVDSSMDNSILQWLTSYFITHMKIPPDRIDIDRSFIEYGIDSILLLGLINSLESYLGQVIAPTIILENPTIRKLTSYFNGVSTVTVKSNLSNPAVDQEHYNEQLIAVIGVSGRFPGAENLSAFWDNLLAGNCEIKSVPGNRLDEINALEKAGFIKDLKCFDPAYFGFSDEYARQLDPLIRLSLELSVEAILNAGYELDEFKGKNCAVLVAARAANYVDYLNSFSKDTISGIGQNFLAAHVSQYFNLSGPNYVVDSACSSSLTAIYLACQHLKSRDIDYALVTGVELLLDNRPFDLLRAGGALSPSQSCKPFSEQADGITLGEGGGAIILKRIQDAINDGDKIEAIICGGAINNDGQTMGITTPNPQSQSAVVKKALDNAGLDPESISYIEAHATGTAIGDPMELAALTQIFPTNNNHAYCAVGSVKSNIGHLLSAAGMASILKVILAMKHHQLPKSLGCDFPNKRFRFEESPFYLVKENLLWTSDETKYAGVSGFGFGGTNVHLILSDSSSINSKYHYIQKRFELMGPQYNKKNIWPKAETYQNDEGMDLFFEIADLTT